ADRALSTGRHRGDHPAVRPRDAEVPRMTSRLAATDIVMRFGGVVAVGGVSLALDQGTVLGLIGPNGSGKTTLLNVLSGTMRPTSGSVFLDGQRIDRLPEYRVVRAGVAKTHQIPKPFPRLTVRENVLAAATFGGSPGA